MALRSLVMFAGLVSAVGCFVVFGYAAALDLGRALATSEQPYRAAPLAARQVRASAVLPAHADKLFALCGLAALPFALRAAGLAKHDRRDR